MPSLLRGHTHARRAQGEGVRLLGRLSVWALSVEGREPRRCDTHTHAHKEREREAFARGELRVAGLPERLVHTYMGGCIACMPWWSVTKHTVPELIRVPRCK